MWTSSAWRQWFRKTKSLVHAYFLIGAAQQEGVDLLFIKEQESESWWTLRGNTRSGKGGWDCWMTFCIHISCWRMRSDVAFEILVQERRTVVHAGPPGRKGQRWKAPKWKALAGMWTKWTTVTPVHEVNSLGRSPKLFNGQWLSEDDYTALHSIYFTMQGSVSTILMTWLHHHQQKLSTE